MKPTHWIGIDPSIDHTGWAVLRELEGLEYPELVASGVVLTGGSRKGDQRFATIQAELSAELGAVFGQQGELAVCGIERPTFENSKRGIQLRQRGFDKLCMAAGVALAVCVEVCQISLITARQWKGTTSKQKIQERVEEIYPVKKGEWVREDEWEAIGLALWMRKHHGVRKYQTIESTSAGVRSGSG
jgi:Holliday junction resolvasome RuvABC endonuclease subunit